MTQRSNLRNAAIVLYATLALLWLAIPRSVSSWAHEYLPEFMLPIAAPVAEAAETAANATRIPLLYEQARSAFQSVTKKP